MKMIKILAALLILSTGSLVYAEYGMIPFSKEVSPDLDIGEDINFLFLGKLQAVGITIKAFGEQPRINYQMAESPEVTIEPVGEDAVKQQLETLSKTENLDGIIFGHIMQDLVKEMVYVIVRVYLVSEPEQYLTFGHKDALGIKVPNVKPEIINERFAQISEDIKTWLRAKQPSSAATPQKSEPLTSEPLVPESDTPAPQQPPLTVETEPPVTKPTNAEPVDIVKNLGGSEDLMYLLGGEELSPKKSEQDVRIDREVKTLKEIYTMLYEQEHYVHPWQKDEQVLRNIAAEKRIPLDSLKQRLKRHWREKRHRHYKNSCWMQGFTSAPTIFPHGKIYKLCFDPSYLEKKSWQCFSGSKNKNIGKMIKRTHKQAKQKLLDLNMGKYKDWRLPTIDELFSMTNFLPISQKNRDFLKFWSSTTKTSQGEVIWGLSVQTVFVPHGRTTKMSYRTYVDELEKNKDSAFLIPVRDCPKLHNPY